MKGISRLAYTKYRSQYHIGAAVNQTATGA